jgi:hypothetical protein
MLLFGRQFGERWRIAWLVGTMVLFCAGFLVVFYVPRYVIPILLPLSVLLLAIQLSVLWDRGPVYFGRYARPLAACGTIALIISFAVIGGSKAEIENITRTPRERPDNLLFRELRAYSHPANIEYRLVARRLHKSHVRGPIASSDELRGTYIACLTQRKFLGFPQVVDAAQAEQMLLEKNVGALVIWRAPSARDAYYIAHAVAPVVADRPGWTCVMSRMTHSTDGVAVYVPSTSLHATTRPARPGSKRRSGAKATTRSASSAPRPPHQTGTRSTGHQSME